MAKHKHSISPQERRKGGADAHHHPSPVKTNSGQFHHDKNTRQSIGPVGWDALGSRPTAP